MKAKDIMITDVPTITGNTPLAEALMTLHGNIGDPSFINAAPGLVVVNERAEIQGILSPLSIITAILECAQEGETPARHSEEYFAELCARVKHLQVYDIMERQAISVTENACITDVADLFVKHRFQRIPVLRGNKVVGIIYRSRLLFAMAKSLL